MTVKYSGYDDEDHIDDIYYIEKGVKLKLNDLVFELSGLAYERLDISENDLQDDVIYNVGLGASIMTKTDHNMTLRSIDTVTGHEDFYIICSAFSGDQEMMRFKMTELFDMGLGDNDKEIGFTGKMYMPEAFQVSANPYLYNYVENYYTNDLTGVLPVRFNRDISSLLDPDAEQTTLSFKDLLGEFKIDHIKIIAVVIHYTLYEETETRDRAEAADYYRKGADVCVLEESDENGGLHTRYNIRYAREDRMIEAVNPAYYKSQSLWNQAYDKITHEIFNPTAEELFVNTPVFQPDENRWNAETYTFTVKYSNFPYAK